MTRLNSCVLGNAVTVALLAVAVCVPGNAAPKATPIPARPPAAIQTQPQVFTVRYVCFVTKPIKAFDIARDGQATAADLPPIMDDLQHGSKHGMVTSPEGFLSDLKATAGDQNFQLLLCGSFPCVNGSHKAASVNVGPQMNDTYQCTLNESMFVEQNSPTMLTLHQTGQLAYAAATSGRDATGWNDVHTDQIVIGRTYSQGIDQGPDGRCIVYAFCILPGRLDQTASVWSSAVKAITIREATARSKSKTAAR